MGSYANVARESSVADSFRALLSQQYGLQIRGHRADCPQCSGSSRLTMAIRGDFAYCHRCKHTIQFRTIARASGVPIPAETPEQRAERARAREFAEWKDTCEKLLSDRLLQLTMIAHAAKRTLAIFPEDEIAWGELADFHHSEASLMACFEFLACEKLPTYLETPVTKERLCDAFGEAVQRAA